jgi:LytS/YehU family sensor histidine kinase
LFISLREEIELLNKYLTLEQLGRGFKYSFLVDKALDIDNIEFPPMLLQPSVENAVKHGVSLLGPQGKILLTFFKKDQDLGVVISDNGTSKTKIENKRSGYGIKFTSERIENLKKICKPAEIIYSMVYTSSGTEVTFIFKHWIA